MGCSYGGLAVTLTGLFMVFMGSALALMVLDLARPYGERDEF